MLSPQITENKTDPSPQIPENKGLINRNKDCKKNKTLKLSWEIRLHHKTRIIVIK